MSGFGNLDMFSVFKNPSPSKRKPEQPAEEPETLKKVKPEDIPFESQDLPDSLIEQDSDNNSMEENNENLLKKFEIEHLSENIGCVHEIVAPKPYTKRSFPHY